MYTFYKNWVGPRADLSPKEKIKIPIPLPGIELRFLSSPALYAMSYLGSR